MADSGGMMIKVILSLMVFFCFAMTFGLALIATKWDGRLECDASDDDVAR